MNEPLPDDPDYTCFVLVLEKRTVVDAEKAAVVVALRSIGEEPTVITLDRSDGDNWKRLERLIWWVGEGKVKGLLVVLFPEGEKPVSLQSLLDFPANRSMISLEQVNQSVDAFSRFPLHNGLALADRQGGHVLAERAGEHCDGAIVVADPPLTPQGNFQFRVVARKHATAEFFHMLLVYRRFGFVRFADGLTAGGQTRDIYKIGTKINAGAVVEGCGEYGISPTRIYSDWLHQEFETVRVAIKVLDKAGEAFSLRGAAAKVPNESPEASPPAPPTLPALFPVSWQIFIGAMRMARLMASWVLEGEVFECSILLTSKNTCEKLAKGKTTNHLTPLFAIASSLPFNFTREDDVRFYAETAQSDEIFLVVDASKGELRSIAVADKETVDKPSRHERFSAFAQDNNIVLHVRTGFVEVYVKQEMAFWHDGFRWLVGPLDALKERIRGHWRFEQKRNTEFTELLMNAICLIMDRKRGSTIILLHDDDDHLLTTEEFEKLAKRKPTLHEPTTAFNAIAGTFLRGELSDPGSNVPSEEKESDQDWGIEFEQWPLRTLASVLSLDGAHAITQSGKLKYIARRIDVREEVVEEEKRKKKKGVGWGTGTQATWFAAQVLTKSTAIRISSSGYIRKFPDEEKNANAAKDNSPRE